jgi:hypothetical protein
VRCSLEKHFIPVWFFIGLLLSIYGALILARGVYGWMVPPSPTIAMAHLHIDIWWGAGMLLFGLFYVICFRPKSKA